MKFRATLWLGAWLGAWLGLGVVLLAAAGLFTYFQWSNELADPDAFYHMRMAQLILERGVITNFVWLPYTTLAQHFIDQHFLYHVLMIPFVSNSAPLVGVKIYTVLLAIGFLTTLALTLRSMGSSWWLVVTSVLALTTPFTFRLNLVKATPLALMLVCLTVLCLYRRQYWWLVPIGIVYVWSYGGFAMMVIVVVTWVIADVFGRFKQSHRAHVETRLIASLKPLMITLIGLAIGIILNPYFPANLSFYWDQLVQIGIINYQNTIGVGAEWYPYNPGRLVFGSIGIVALALLGLVTTVLRVRPWRQLDWFALGMLFVGIILTLKSRRYVEYFGPFTAIAAALWLRHVSLGTKGIIQRITQRFARFNKQTVLYTGLVGLTIIMFTPIVLNDIQVNKDDIRSGTPIQRYAAAGTWLKDNASPGSKILHSDWDDFPALFFHNSDNAYMNGLDPTFMYRYDADLYYLWEDITLGHYTGDLTAALTTLDVEYVIIEQNHTDMYNLIAPSSVTELVYSDDEVDIFKVVIK